MSPPSARAQDQGVTTSKSPMDISPFLRLPVNLRHKIYHHATEHEKWPDRHPDGRQCSRLATLEPQQRALLTSDRTNTEGPQLIYSHPLSRVSKQVRAELCTWLRTTSTISVVTKVRDFDFSHVQYFLSTSEEDHQEAFRLHHDGGSDRKLTIELQGPYTMSCIERLRHWIEYVTAFVGPEKRAELCALYKTIDVDGPKRAPIIIVVIPSFRPYRDDLYRRVPVAVLKDVHEYYDTLAPGGGEVEAHKIMRTLYCWVDLDWLYGQEHVDVLGKVREIV